MSRKLAHDALAMIEYRDQPPVLVVADSPAAMARAAEAAALAGCRLVDSISPSAGLDRLRRQGGMAAVLVELDEHPGEMLNQLLDGLARDAQADRHGVVIVAPPALIDTIAERTFDAPVQHLCEPSEAERAEAIAAASSRSPARLHDVGKENGRLQQLSAQVGRIASILATLSEAKPAATDHAATDRDAAPPEITAAQIRALIRARRLREQFFGPDLFADPAWDMLLDLMAARLEGQRVAVSSLCIAAAVPPTTALRWIKTLTESGHFVRSADPQDGRRIHIELSDEAAAILGAYLSAVRRSTGMVL